MVLKYIICIFMFSGPVYATPIPAAVTFNIDTTVIGGSIGFASNPFSPFINLGDPVSGSYTFDSTTVDANPLPLGKVVTTMSSQRRQSM